LTSRPGMGRSVGWIYMFSDCSIQGPAVRRRADSLAAAALAAALAVSGIGGGARAEAEKLGAPFLGEIPLDLDIRLGSDGGVPIVVSKPESPQAKAFQRIADDIITSDLYARDMR